MDKKEIRKKILKKRRSLEAGEVEALSAEICVKIMDSEEYNKALDVCIYMPINNEVDVTLLVSEARSDGKQLWLPKTCGDAMDFFRYDKDTPLEEGNYNVPEPVSDEMLKPDESTLIIMPGAVFSKSRDRIGYGGGYYDRYLGKYPQCMTAAVCYDFQILERIPAEEHDRKPDAVISEKRIITE